MANQKILRYGTANQWMIVMDGDRGIAPGGFNRQVLTKLSGTDYDAQWRDPAGFTFTQGAAPTVGLDTTSALTTGQTWWDTATGNGYVRVATQWVQFAWGDSEARYVNTTGDTINGQLTLNGGGGETMELRPGAADHVYIEFFARTSNPASRSAYLGFPAAGSTTFTIANSLPGDIALAPSTGRVSLNADPTSALHAATKQYVDAQDAATAALRVAKTGDTMSGILTMNANINMGTGRKIDFTDELGMKVDLYGGSYWLGIASGTLQYASGGVHQFYGQVNVDSHFSAAGSVYANSGRVRMGAWQSAAYAGGWGGLVGSRGYILIDYSDGSGGNMHVRGNNVLYIGGDSSDNMYFHSGRTQTLTDHYFSGGISVAGGLTAANLNTSNGSVIATGTDNTQDHGSLMIQARSYGVATGYSLWCINYGMAPCLTAHGSVGEMARFTNNAGTDFNWVGAADFIKQSSREHKVNVRTVDAETIENAKAAIRSVRSVRFDGAAGEQHIKASPRFKDVNKRWQEKGHAELTLIPEHTVVEAHDCTKSDRCVGTAEVPCGIYSRSKDQRGFIAEEMAVALPDAVTFDIYNEPVGISYSVIVTELWDVVKELMEKVDVLETQLAAAG